MEGAFLSLNRNERIFFAVFTVIVATFLFVAPFFILPRIYAGREGWINTAPPNSVILELWEIDTFEGGSASRAKFLEKNAYLYQTEVLDTYVLVRALGLEQARTMLSQGSRPDIVSFGIGAGELIQPISTEFGEIDGVRADLLSGGLYEGNQYAVPWCLGGYVLCASSDFGEISQDNFSKKGETCDNNLIITGCNYNVPTLNLNENYSQYLANDKYTQYEAYDAYLHNLENKVLLGTQRDFYRLNNKVDNGVISAMNYEYIDNYTDLIQYMAITTDNEKFIPYAQKFIEFITSARIQQKLTSIKMFTVNGEYIYNDEYADFEKALNNKLQVLNVFTPNVKLTELQNKR